MWWFVQGYGFVEFSLPEVALACKAAMDAIETAMRPDPRQPAKPNPGPTPKPAAATAQVCHVSIGH